MNQGSKGIGSKGDQPRDVKTTSTDTCNLSSRRQQRCHAPHDLADACTRRVEMGLHGKRLCEQQTRTAKAHDPHPHDSAKQSQYNTRLKRTTTTEADDDNDDTHLVFLQRIEKLIVVMTTSKPTRTTNSVPATLWDASDAFHRSPTARGPLQAKWDEACRGSTWMFFVCSKQGSRPSVANRHESFTGNILMLNLKRLLSILAEFVLRLGATLWTVKGKRHFTK